MAKYQDLDRGAQEEAEYYARQDPCPKEAEANLAPNCRWAARQGAKRRCGWVCVKLITALSALLALTWSFKFGALRFLHTTHSEATYEKTWTFNNLNDFSLHHLVGPHRAHRCREEPFKSSFVVLRAEQQDDVVVHFTFKASPQELLDQLEVKKDDDSLIITYPTTDGKPRPHYECIRTHTEMHVRRGLNLKGLDIKYLLGEFAIPEPLELTVENAGIYVALGSLHANQFNGRKTNITVDAGSVTGTFALLDELSINTRLGSIKATIEPKPADPSAVQPATFSAVSHLGMVDIDFFPVEPGPGSAAAAVPPRDYRTHVVSHAGAIAGRYLHGSATKLETENGEVRVALLPVAVPGRADDDETSLVTRTARGRVAVVLLDPASSPSANEADGGASATAAAAVLSGLQSEHSSRMGEVSVRYPASWQGAVEGESRVGRVRMAGEGLEIVRRSRKGVGMFVEGRKGEEAQSSALCTTDVGAVEFVVGGF